MASVQYEVGSDSTVIGSAGSNDAMKGLVDDGNALSIEIDNSGESNLYLFDDVEIVLGSTTYAKTEGLELYLIRIQLDDVDYEDGDNSIDPPAANLVGVFECNGGTGAENHILRQIPIPPSKFKYLVINSSGIALNNTAYTNQLRRRPFRYETT